MRLSLLVTFALGFAACTIHSTDAPPDLTGPSGFARSLSVTASPDSIENGSQSLIVATLLDESGAPVPNARLEASLENGSIGTLDSRTIYTDTKGKATVVYAAPVASAFFAGGPSKIVYVVITPVGNNYETAVSQHAAIKVTPPPVPPATLGAPTAAVTYSPTAPKAGQLVLFDASTSVAGSDHTIASYFWDFGDGQPNEEHGSDASHAYTAPGTYIMVLGVVDNLGLIDSDFKTIVVTQ